MVTLALSEDVGDGDITAKLLPEEVTAVATVVCRQKAICCGQSWFDEVFSQLDPLIKTLWRIEEGGLIEKDDVVVELRGPVNRLLTGERVALNFLQTLSAVATQTHEFVEEIKDTNTVLLDTRKTLPMWREAQKYAVTMGGGQNHRMGLYDQYLIKENHIKACGSIHLAIEKARALQPNKVVEVEVESLDELKQAIEAKPDIIMLDNFSEKMINEAASCNRGNIKLEVSGDVKLKTIKAIAKSGVDLISVGAITKNINAVDFSMRIETIS